MTLAAFRPAMPGRRHDQSSTLPVAHASGAGSRHFGRKEQDCSSDGSHELNSRSAGMDHVLITGAGGYIGSVLVDDLLRADYRVTAVDRFFFGENVHHRHRNNPNFCQRKVDIRDLRPPDFEGVDAVRDLAALSNDPSADIDPALTEAINFSGRLHVATCAKEAGVRRYVLSSSCSIYGVGNDDTLDENAPPRPLTAYAKASYKAEQSTGALASRTSPGHRSERNRVRSPAQNAIRPSRQSNDAQCGPERQDLHFRWGKTMAATDSRSRRLHRHDQHPPSTFRQDPRPIVQRGFANYQVLSLAYVVRETLPFPIDVDIAPDDETSAIIKFPSTNCLNASDFDRQ